MPEQEKKERTLLEAAIAIGLSKVVAESRIRKLDKEVCDELTKQCQGEKLPAEFALKFNQATVVKPKVEKAKPVKKKTTKKK